MSKHLVTLCYTTMCYYLLDCLRGIFAQPAIWVHGFCKCKKCETTNMAFLRMKFNQCIGVQSYEQGVLTRVRHTCVTVKNESFQPVP